MSANDKTKFGELPPVLHYSTVLKVEATAKRMLEEMRTTVTWETIHDAWKEDLRKCARWHHLEVARITAAQTELLGLATKALQGLYDGVNESRCRGHNGFPLPDCIKRMHDAKEALAHLAKSTDIK